MEISRSAQTLLTTLSKTVGAEVDWLISAKGYTRAELEPIIEELALAKLVTVHGPPNQNATLGLDADRIELTALGYMNTGR